MPDRNRSLKRTADSSDLTRRTWLRLGSLGLLGGGWLRLLAAQGALRPRRARACLILFQVGGPYQCETFDPKPDAPEEMRGLFRRAATSASGVFVTEGLPLTAKHGDKLALVRSVHHTIRCHNPAIYCSLVGREATDPMAVSNRTAAQRSDHPHYASVIARLRPGPAELPRHVIIPDVTNNGPAKSPGLLAGYLGTRYDPFVLKADPSAADYRAEGIGLVSDDEVGRVQERQTLLQQLDSRQRRLETSGAVEALDTHYRQAFAVLTSGRAKQAFDLAREPAKVRDRYGRHIQGQSTLLARRLIEAGVPFVTVFSHTDVDRGSWDTHQRHAERARELMPVADQTFSALLGDLSDRGLLDEVVVIWMGEFGRTPRMGVNFSNNSNNVGGRDHWCNCYSVVLAGGGVQGGRVIGSSDWIGGYPKERPVHISDLGATVFHALGVDPRAQLYDLQGQLRFICDGHPLMEAF